MAITVGTNTAATRSARRCTGALPAWASWTRRAIWASLVSAPTRTARTTSRPPALTVPPVTASPGPTSTGTGSPVSSEASMADDPSSTTPSVATFSPGRTTKRSPATRSSMAMRCSTDRRPVAQHGDVLGAELEQRPQRRPGVALGASLEVAAGENERRHPGGDLEEDLARRHVAVGDQAESVAQAWLAGVAEEQGVQRPAESGEHADGHQRVHRRGGVAQIHPRRPVERPGAPRHHGSGEGERQPLPVVELERRQHSEGDHRHRQQRRDDEAPASVVHGVVVAVDVRRLGGNRAGDVGSVAGRLDGGDEIVDVDRCRGAHLGLFGGEVDGRLDAVESVQPLLDACRAGRARHPVDLEIDLEPSGAVSGRLRHRDVSPCERRGRRRAR